MLTSYSVEEIKDQSCFIARSGLQHCLYHHVMFRDTHTRTIHSFRDRIRRLHYKEHLFIPPLQPTVSDFHRRKKWKSRAVLWSIQALWHCRYRDITLHGMRGTWQLTLGTMLPQYFGAVYRHYKGSLSEWWWFYCFLLRRSSYTHLLTHRSC